MDIIEERDINDLVFGNTKMPNFTNEEMNMFENLIREHKDVIMSKNRGKITSKMREQTWKQIADEYNSDPVCQVKRDVNQLKCRWNYIKKKVRKEYRMKNALQSQSRASKSPESTASFLVLEALPETIDLPSHVNNDVNFDDDSDSHKSVSSDDDVNSTDFIQTWPFKKVKQELNSHDYDEDGDDVNGREKKRFKKGDKRNLDNHDDIIQLKKKKLALEVDLLELEVAKAKIVLKREALALERDKREFKKKHKTDIEETD